MYKSPGNPSVQSKAEKWHGKPHTPGKVTHPGGVAPISGTTVSGHTAEGHMIPRETSVGQTDSVKK